MAINPLRTNNMIDSCAFDPKYEPEASASVEIFKLANEGKIGLIIAHSTQKEIDHPNTPKWVKVEALSLIYTLNEQLNPDERMTLERIEAILAGNGKVVNIKQDAQHIFEAQRYGHYFITTDKRLLDKAAEVRTLCTVTILRPSEFLDIVRKHTPTT
jgi:predicted nucleic acid-binding protein